MNGEPKRWKKWLGAGVWITILGLGGLAARTIPPSDRYAFGRTQTELWRGWMSPSPRYLVEFPGGSRIDRGDGVFSPAGGEWRRVGEVIDVQTIADSTQVTLLLDTAREEDRLPADSRVVRRSQPASLLYCLQTLMPEARRNEIRREWESFLATYRGRLMTQLRPLVPELAREVSEFLGGEVQRVLAGRTADVETILGRYRQEIGQERLFPLLGKEIWPIVQQHAGPAAESIGRKLWDRAPLFDLAWRAAYDRVLADRPVKLESRWKAFVRDEAIPILRDNETLLQETFRQVLHDVARSETVQSTMKDIATMVVTDPELQRLAVDVIREVLLDNPRLEAFLQDLGNDPAIQNRLGRVNDLMQRFFNRLGNLLVYDSSGTTINAELARVLRLLLLRQDDQYLFLERGVGPALADGEALIGIHEG